MFFAEKLTARAKYVVNSGENKIFIFFYKQFRSDAETTLQPEKIMLQFNRYLYIGDINICISP